MKINRIVFTAAFLLLSLAQAEENLGTGIFNSQMGPQLTDAWFQQHPQNDRFQLKSGEVVKLPLHSTPAGFMLHGTADIKSLNRELAGQGVYPVPIQPGRTLVIVYGEDFKNASLGRYQEMTIMVPVTQKPHRGFGVIRSDLSFLAMFAPGFNKIFGGVLPDTYLYIWKMYVTTQKAYDVGREIWGYPKELADIRLDDHPTAGISMRLDSHNSLCRMNMRAGGSFWPNGTLKLNMDLYTLTPKDIQQTKRHILLKGRMQVKKYNPALDAFDPDLSTDCGSSLQRVGFRPFGWQKNSNDMQIGFR